MSGTLSFLKRSKRRIFDKRSKRRIQQIRWTRREIISAVVLLLAMVVFCVFVALWMASHDVD